MKQERAVPSELQDKVEDINKWIQNPHGQVVEAYWHESSDFGDEWKLRIKDRSGEVVMDSLCAATADGHTYYLFLQAMRNHNQKSFKSGAEDAMKRLYESQCAAISVRAHPFRKD